MRRSVSFIFAAAVLLCLASCARQFKDVKVTSVNLVSLAPRGFTAVDALLEVGVDNPAPEFVVQDLTGLVKLDGEPWLDLKAEDIVIKGKMSRKYSIPVKGALSGGFNPFSLLTMLQDIDWSRITLDVSARVSLPGGAGKVIELKDLPLDEMIKKGKEGDII